MKSEDDISCTCENRDEEIFKESGCQWKDATDYWGFGLDGKCIYDDRCDLYCSSEKNSSKMSEDSTSCTCKSGEKIPKATGCVR